MSGAGDPWMESGGEVALVAVSRSTALAAFLLKAGRGDRSPPRGWQGEGSGLMWKVIRYPGCRFWLN